MSQMKMEFPCEKFQENVFDPSRCQNCFKSRELHVTTREDLEQVKPIYASWLCIAPEGLDFDKPVQRSRKWQRRFFVLYENGCLEFALDELLSTIPQGTINLHQCNDVIHAEERTGQKNTLCIITPEKEIYIRGDSKDIISGWCEQLLVFRQTNEQGRKRKEGSWTPVLSKEEASTMKSMYSIEDANTGAVEANKLCNPSREDEPSEESEDMNIGHDVKFTTVDADSLSSGKWNTLDIKQTTSNVDTHQTKDASLFHHLTSLHSPDPWRAVTPDWSPSNLHLNSSASHSLHWQEDDAESNDERHSKVLSLAKHMTQDQGNTAKLQAKTLQDECDKVSCFIKCSTNVDECWTDENEQTRPQCTNRSQTACIQIMEKSAGQLESPHSNITPHRRLQTVEAKAADSTMTPDLLNFKKGWLLMYAHDQWRKYWFVLSAHSLRYYFDSVSEEASQLVGEIDLTTCHRVTELHDQRNFVFEIWTHRMTYKLATVTAGLQQNWMKALTKNIQDQNAPNVARMGTHSGPDVTQESMTLSCPVKDKCHKKHRFDQFRRGRENPKTSSSIWTHMFTQKGTREQERVEQNAEESINRRRGREERRQKYTIVMGSTVCLSEERNSSTQENQQQERMREIEKCWLRVEKMAIREEKRVQLYPVCQDSVEPKKLLEHYMTRMEELNIQSELANQDYSQDHGHSTHCSLGEQTCDLVKYWELQRLSPDKQNPSLTDKYQETNGHHIKDRKRQQINALVISEDTDRDQTMLKLLSQEAEFLTRQNKALNQRNQELVNQLAEADREIDRLKAELVYHSNGNQSERESIVECLDLEFARSCGKLQEAQTQLTKMEDSLMYFHPTLQLKEATLRGLNFLAMDSECKMAFPDIIDRLCQCVQVVELKVCELVSQQWLSTMTCNELQSQNILMKFEVNDHQQTMENYMKNEMLQRELEANIRLCKGVTTTKDQQCQNRIETVEELKKRSSVFGFLLKVVSQLAGNVNESVSEHETAQINPKELSWLQMKSYIWQSFVNHLKATTSDSMEIKYADCLLQSAEIKLEEVKMYHSALCRNLGLDHSGNTSTHPDIIEMDDGKIEKEKKHVIWKGLKEHIEKSLILIDHLTSKVESFTSNANLSKKAVQCLIWMQKNAFSPIISIVMDIMAAYLIEKLSHPVIMQKPVAIQTEKQKMMLEQDNMAEISEGPGREIISNLKSHIKEIEHLLCERLTSLQQHDEDKQTLKAAFEQGISLLKESHRKEKEILLKHQQEQEMLHKEKERLLTEEVAACLTVIKAMKRAHSSELNKILQKAYREKMYSCDTNIDVILKNHSEELSAVQRELYALSEQYTQKCLENVCLAKALQAEGDALQQCHCKYLALIAQNQELTSDLVKKIMRWFAVAKDGCGQLGDDREQYELMIKLQVKEFYQQQEIDALKTELSAAKMDQKFASEKNQEIQTELSLVKDTAEQHISQLKENLKLVYKALEESLNNAS
ncbi:myosin phosphatase Rho-interacting protein-like [Silurus meridionalis]|uniref:PH domain-containing protein n=1 Tax=Silurus meridionalis TaxID=175797 RepID=A0A8T0AYZ5_SILME|nr:myosin phosphatase Rho-interacting protein-like [Silurus meridionalis]KAF7698186.1 hypothetical protein HF521_004696 [Silurus meridionalis]